MAEHPAEQPTANAAQLDLLKKTLPTTDDSNDNLLLTLLAVARDYITQHTDIPIPATECVDVLDGEWRQAWLKAYPVQSVTSIKTNDVDTSQYYRVREAVGSIERHCGAPAGETVVTYTAGLPAGDVPVAIDMACALLAAALYKSGEHGGKQVTQERLGDYQVQYAAVSGYGLAVLSPAAGALLRPYVRPKV